jgi:hypothetical protein
VLFHDGFGEPHYDLMFESSPGSALVTWRAVDWPIVAGDELIRLADHRRDYLDYEGPVSNNRGHVRRIVAGECEFSSVDAHVTIRILSPEPLLILLSHIADDRWHVVEVE